jgi:hypothetical protein
MPASIGYFYAKSDNKVSAIFFLQKFAYQKIISTHLTAAISLLTRLDVCM